MANLGYGAAEGPINYTTKSVTAAYTVEPGVEVVLADASGGAFTVSLPAPSLPTSESQAQANPVLGIGNIYNAGQRVTVINVGASNAVTVDGLKPQYIRAGGKVTLSNNDSSAAFVSDGSFWDCLGKVS